MRPLWIFMRPLVELVLASLYFAVWAAVVYGCRVAWEVSVG